MLHTETNLNNLEIQILKILEDHKGKENAIRRFVLIEQINAAGPHGNAPVQERMIRKTIKHLTTQHEIAIGSWHYGYFLAVTPNEIEEVCRYYDRYGLSSLFVSSKLRKIEMKDFLGQLAMKWGDSCRGDS